MAGYIETHVFATYLYKLNQEVLIDVEFTLVQIIILTFEILKWNAPVILDGMGDLLQKKNTAKFLV